MMNNKKSVKLMFKLHYYSVIINDPYINGIRVVKQGVSDIIDIKPYVLLDGNIPINSSLEDVSINEKNVFFYFKDFGYAKIKIKNLVNKKKYKDKSNWKVFKNNHIIHMKNIPNDFKLSEELGHSSFGLFRSNWDSHLDTLIVSWNKLIKVNLTELLSKLKISPNYEASGLAVDGNNNIIYIRLKNTLEDDVIYIRSNFINLNYTDYKNWEIIKNKIGDKTMEKNNEKMSEKDIEEVMSSELEKEILDDTIEEDEDPIESDEQYMHHAMFPYEESTLNLDDNDEDEDEDEDEDKDGDDEDEDEGQNNNEEFEPNTIKKSVTLYLDKLTAIDEYLLNNIKFNNFRIRDKIINELSKYNFKCFETVLNLLYIGELFTITRTGYSNGVKTCFKGYNEMFKCNKNATSSIHINIVSESELEIILDLYVDEEDSYYKGIGRVRALVNSGFDSTKYSVSTPNGSVKDILDCASCIGFINSLINSNCRDCKKGCSNNCFINMDKMPSNRLNTIIVNGIIEINEGFIDFFKSSNEFFDDIYKYVIDENKKTVDKLFIIQE